MPLHNDFTSIRIAPNVGTNVDYFFAISGLSHASHLLFHASCALPFRKRERGHESRPRSKMP